MLLELLYNCSAESYSFWACFAKEGICILNEDYAKWRGPIWEKVKKPGNPSPGAHSCHSLRRAPSHHYRFLHRQQQRGGRAGCGEDRGPARPWAPTVKSLFMTQALQGGMEGNPLLVSQGWVGTDSGGRTSSLYGWNMAGQGTVPWSSPQVPSSGQVQWSRSLLSIIFLAPSPKSLRRFQASFPPYGTGFRASDQLPN